MTQNYLVSDGLTRIRNAQLARAESTVLLYSKLISDLLNILVENGFILRQEKFEERKGVTRIRVHLKYSGKLHTPVITTISTVSKPGRKVYKKLKDVTATKGGLGITILSTSSGVMTDHKARKIGAGGEILCKVF
jgi:small subunit ribosomal protein S8